MSRKLFWELSIISLLIFILSVDLALAATTATTITALKTTAKSSKHSAPKAAKTVDLSFPRPAVVKKVLVKKGDQVKAGQLLIEFNTNELNAQLIENKAILELQRDRLEELKVGGKKEIIKSEQLKVKNAQITLNGARQAVVDAIQGAFTYADDAVRAKTDQVFTNTHGDFPQLSIPANNLQTINNINNKRAVIEQLLNNWSASFDDMSIAPNVRLYMDIATTNLAKIKSLLDIVSYFVNGLTNDANYPTATLRNWRSDILIGRTNVDVAVKNLTAAIVKYDDAESKLDIARADFATKIKPAGDNEKMLQMGRIQEAVAKIETLQNNINGMKIVASTDGEVVVVRAIKNLIIVPNAPLISLKPIIKKGK